MTPKLPDAIHTALGPVVVSDLPPEARDDCLGRFHYARRRIEIDPTMPPGPQWQTFWHEVAHVAFLDSGVHETMSKEQHEAACDALGLLFAQMTLAGTLTVTAPKGRTTVCNAR